MSMALSKKSTADIELDRGRTAAMADPALNDWDSPSSPETID
jgi:hypothetical protein